MHEILTQDELVELTEKKQPSAQAIVLEHLGINFKRRPSGTLFVLRDDVTNGKYLPRTERDKTLNMDRLRLINAKEAHA